MTETAMYSQSFCVIMVALLLLSEAAIVPDGKYCSAGGEKLGDGFDIFPGPEPSKFFSAINKCQLAFIDQQIRL